MTFCDLMCNLMRIVCSEKKEDKEKKELLQYELGNFELEFLFFFFELAKKYTNKQQRRTTASNVCSFCEKMSCRWQRREGEKESSLEIFIGHPTPLKVVGTERKKSLSGFGLEQSTMDIQR